MSQIVTDAAGQQHEFPDGATPEQMSHAMRQVGDANAATAQARAQGRDSWANVGADSLTTGIEAVKGAGRALMSPLTALLHPQDTWQGVKDMGTAAKEAYQHPSEIGPAFLQGAADPQTMGNAIGATAVALAPKFVPPALRALKGNAAGVSSGLNSAAQGVETLGELRHPTFGAAAKGLRYAAGKLAPEVEETPAFRPRKTGRGTMSPAVVDRNMPNTSATMPPMVDEVSPVHNVISDQLRAAVAEPKSVVDPHMPNVSGAAERPYVPSKPAADLPVEPEPFEVGPHVPNVSGATEQPWVPSASAQDLPWTPPDDAIGPYVPNVSGAAEQPWSPSLSALVEEADPLKVDRYAPNTSATAPPMVDEMPPVGNTISDELRAATAEPATEPTGPTDDSPRLSKQSNSLQAILDEVRAADTANDPAARSTAPPSETTMTRGGRPAQPTVDWETADIPDVEVMDPLESRGPNASGAPGGSSLEELKRSASMGKAGQKFVVIRNGQEFPATVDYRVRPGEKFGVKGPNGFSIRDVGE